MHNRRIRWAASVYGRHPPELRPQAEETLRSVVEEDSRLRWISREYHGEREVSGRARCGSRGRVDRQQDGGESRQVTKNGETGNMDGRMDAHA